MPSAITTKFFGAEVRFFPIEGSDDPHLYRAMWLDEEAGEIKYLGKWKHYTRPTPKQGTIRPTTVSSDGGSTTDEDTLPPPPVGKAKHRRTKARSGPYTRTSNQ
jgi:hypothetical protein